MPIDINQLKQAIEAELAELTSELKTIATQDTVTGDWVAIPDGSKIANADPNVEADIVEDWNERRATVSQLEMRYHNLKLALDKHQNHTYGQCEICDEQIEDARLNANPAARTCKIHLERERELPL